MFIPLAAAVSIEEFLGYDTEMQISMYESLLRVYGTKYLPDWLRAVYCYTLDLPCAAEVLAYTYPELIEFSCVYCDYAQAGFADFDLAEETNRQAAEYWFAEQPQLDVAA